MKKALRIISIVIGVGAFLNALQFVFMPARVAERGLETTHAERAVLRGYELRFNKAGRHHPGVGHANIEKSLDDLVEGVMYHFESDTEILKMDPFERAPWNYGREAIQVETGNGLVWTWTYFANRALKRDDLNPSQAYLDHLLAGERYLSRAYFVRLRSWETS